MSQNAFLRLDNLYFKKGESVAGTGVLPHPRVLRMQKDKRLDRAVVLRSQLNTKINCSKCKKCSFNAPRAFVIVSLKVLLTHCCGELDKFPSRSL